MWGGGAGSVGKCVESVGRGVGNVLGWGEVRSVRQRGDVGKC